MEKKQGINYRRMIRCGYLLGMAVMAGLVLAVLVGRQMPQEMGQTDTFFLTDHAWTLDAGGSRPAELDSLSKYYKKGSRVLSIYYTLPETDDRMSLVYRSKDVYTKILVNGQIIYETKKPESPFYNKSPGNIWNTVELKREYSEKTIEMQVEYVYNTGTVTVDHVCLGHEAAVITSLVRKKTGALLVSVLMIFAGLFMIVMDAVPKKNEKISHGILYMGIYSLDMGLWSLLETNVVQFFVADARFLQLLDNILMVVGVLPLFLYMDCEYGILKNRFVRILCGADTLFLLLCGAGQFTGLTDLHDLLKWSWLFMGSFFLVLVVFLTRSFAAGIKKGEKNRMVLLQMLGITGIWVITIVDLLRYTSNDTMDRAQILRPGMLVFILMFAVSSELNAFKLMQNGMQYEIIRNLAYQDGLTGLGNRTAYLEQIEHYEKIRIEKVGMVFLDVNNLKQVNDHLGHEEGDKLLQLSAEVIASTFGKYGKSYRIGGDEFCVFFEEGQPEVTYRGAKEEFYEAVNQVNSAQCYPFYLQIAHGFAQCENATKMRLKEMADQADTLMYINKEQLKRSIRTA